MQYPDFEEEFIITSDSSNFALGAVLSQGEIGKDLPIAYASRTLNKHEEKYSVIQKELLRIIWAISTICFWKKVQISNGPLQNNSATEVVNTLLVFFMHYGTPQSIHCDRGKEFDNQLL